MTSLDRKSKVARSSLSDAVVQMHDNPSMNIEMTEKKLESSMGDKVLLSTAGNNECQVFYDEVSKKRYCVDSAGVKQWLDEDDLFLQENAIYFDQVSSRRYFVDEMEGGETAFLDEVHVSS